MKACSKNYFLASSILLAEWVVMYTVLRIGSEVVADITAFQGATILMQVVAMMSVPVVCLFLFHSYNKQFFVLQDKGMLIVLSVLYMLFFFHPERL